MSTAPAMSRPEAIAIAKAFVDLLEGAYVEVKVAGSLRRRLAVVHDIEVVAVPKVGTVATGLFGEEQPRDFLAERMASLLADGIVSKRLDARGAPRWGPTLKYLTFRGARVDLFCPEAARFGWILLLRTGPAPFSRQLVVPRRDDRGRPGRTRDGRPGLLPVHVKPSDGWLTYRTSGERIETREEESVFDLFGLPYLEPHERV